MFAWLVTIVALYFAFRLADWGVLYQHLKSAHLGWLLLAWILTISSYIFRARRWQIFFPSALINFVQSARVLFFGFFMNNVLPARAGEFARAHLGSKITGETRTLVLATIASERLADGLTISLMFVLFSFGLGGEQLSHNLLYVAAIFGVATIGVAVVLIFRVPLFTFADKLSQRFDHKAASYTFDRFQTFINGLSPLYHKEKIPFSVAWSILIWTVELGVYYSISQAFSVDLPWSYCVLFLVTVNFSSLIPAAPGGIGVIEALASTVLVSLGLDRELALAMVISQHIIQYLSVGIPGIIVMMTLKHSHNMPIAESNGQRTI